MPKPENTLPKITSRKQAEEVLEKYAVHIAVWDSHFQKLDDAIAKLRTAAQPDIDAAKSEMDKCHSALEAWANKATDDFGVKRSVEMRHGVVGFRLRKPRLELLDKVTWRDVIGKLKGKLKKYLRPSVDVNKALILSHATADTVLITKAELKKIGVNVKQDDCFYIEVKNESKP